MKHSSTARVASVLTVCALSLMSSSFSSARANDGGLAWGGSPSLLKSHPSISMQSEVVTMTIGAENVLVDCRFVFRNSGPATKVRMGFPDEGSGDRGFYEGAEAWKSAKPSSNFSWFKSWVDGAQVKTELVKGGAAGELWHAKTVSFAAKGRRVVRDQYSVPIGGQIVRGGIYKQAAYTLRTGASWKGPIGRSEIIVRWSQPLAGSKLRAIPMSKVPFVVENGDKDYVFDKVMKPGVVVVSSGPGMPTVSAGSLRWVRTNWRPQQKDDLHLLFGFRSHEQMQSELASKTIINLPLNRAH